MLFVVLRPFRAVLCSPTRERGAWNAQRKLRKLLHKKLVSIAMPVREGWLRSNRVEGFFVSRMRERQC